MSASSDASISRRNFVGLAAATAGMLAASGVTGGTALAHADEGTDRYLVWNLSAEPASWDPTTNSESIADYLVTQMFEGLTYPTADGFEPGVAESWDVSDDGLTYTFHLRDNAKWSDGTPVTAKDFEYSWKRAANPETAADYSYMFNGIAGYPDNLDVTASEDGKTLTVVLTAPCAYFLDLAAFPTFYAVKQETVESAEGYLGDDGSVQNPGAWALEAGFVSSGAYTLTEWKHNESMVYTKNPYYWDAENVKLETLEFMLSADDTAIYAAYNSDDLDFIDTVPNDEIQSLLENPEFHIVDELGTYYICFNVKSDLFAGKTVEQAADMRKAFSKLIDRQYIIDTVGQTGQKIATTFIPEGMADGNGGVFKANDDAYTFPDAEALGYYGEEVDTEGAIELLKSAGYEFDDSGMLSADTPISFEYLTNESSGHIAIAECVQQDLAMIGIDMTIRTCDWNVFLNDRKAGNYDIARNGWIADFNDPINMLEMWTTDSGNNDVQFGR